MSGAGGRFFRTFHFLKKTNHCWDPAVTIHQRGGHTGRDSLNVYLKRAPLHADGVPSWRVSCPRPGPRLSAGRQNRPSAFIVFGDSAMDNWTVALGNGKDFSLFWDCGPAAKVLETTGERPFALGGGSHHGSWLLTTARKTFRHFAGQTACLLTPPNALQQRPIVTQKN